MPALSQLLERLRRASPPPGAAARVVAVPAVGDPLAGEVAFAFDALDEIERDQELLVSAGRADAAQIESVAVRRRARLLTQARDDGERVARELLAERRAGCAVRARQILDDGSAAADAVLARGRERTPELAALVADRLLRTGP